MKRVRQSIASQKQRYIHITLRRKAERQPGRGWISLPGHKTKPASEKGAEQNENQIQMKKMKPTAWIYALSLCTLLAATSCRDEFPIDTMSLMSADTGRLEKTVDDSNAGLVRMTDGNKTLWKATRRVPLVGMGRTIGNMSQGLLSVISTEGNFNNLLDYNIDNAATVSGLASVDAAYSQIVSIKDMYRTYAGGQTVGFVCSQEGSTGVEAISLNLLKLFTITIYNDGKLVKTYNATDESGVLALNLLSISDSDNKNARQTISVTVEEGLEFDEIALGCPKLANLSALSKMNIYYAFVGETPMRTTVKDGENEDSKNAYNQASIYNPKGDIFNTWSNWAERDELVDNDPENGPVIELIGAATNWLAGGYRMTVDFGEEIPAGSEVGFYYTSGSLLSLELGLTITMQTYNEDPFHGLSNDPAIEEYQVANVLGASALSGGGGTNSFITKKPFQLLYLNLIGLEVDAGVTQYHYAYTRAQTKTDVTSYFNIPERITSYTDSYQFFKPEEGKVTYSVTPPTGVNAEHCRFTDDCRLHGMTAEGEYEVTATYERDGYRFTQTTIVTREIVKTEKENSCNTLITKEEHTAEIAGGGTTGSGSLICLLCEKAEDTEYLLDDDLSTSMKYMAPLDVIGNRNIVSVHNITNLKKEIINSTYRAGFILQVNNELLSLNALNYLYVKLYQGNEEISSQVSGSRPTVDLGLLNKSENKMRISATVEGGKQFDRIELYYAGIAALNFNSIRLYGVFYEPVDANNPCTSSGVAEACMELVTPFNYGAQVNYDAIGSGLIEIEGSAYSFDNILDNNMDSYAVIPQNTIGDLNKPVLGVKFREMPAGQTIGIILRDTKGIADINLLNQLKLAVYDKNGISQGETEISGGVLDVGVIGYEDKTYIELTPNKPFSEVRLIQSGLLTLLNTLEVCGVYTRVDANRDGIPDCDSGSSDDSEFITPQGNNIHFCGEKEELSIPVWGGKADSKYTLMFQAVNPDDITEEWGDSFTEEAAFSDGRVTVGFDNPLETGLYLVDFPNPDGNGADYYNNYQVYIHPEKTTWQGDDETNPTDWNTWANWDKGAPWGCTDVVIPAGCPAYPALKGDKNNYCNNIQFLAGSEVINTQYLDYQQAWVDLAFTGGQDVLLSAPLKATYTGDIFTNEAYDSPADGQDEYAGCWKEMSDKAELHSDFRFTPQVYHYKFGGYVNNETESGQVQLRPGDDNWTSAFNLVAEEYKVGTGFLVRMGGNGGSHTVSLPKRYDSYQYYDLTTQQMMPGRTEQLARTSTGRFIYENADGTVPAFPIHIQLENERPGETYLAGNPFMAHLDLDRFFEANAAVGEVKVLRGGSLTSITRADSGEKVAPGEAFLIVLRRPYSETSRYRTTIHFTGEMQVQGYQTW